MNILFAWRYFKSKKNTNAINIIAWVSVVAIAVVTAALVIVLSVFNGFEHLVKGLYADFYADIKITPTIGKTALFNPSLIQKITSNKSVAFYSKIIEDKAVLVNDDFQTIIYLKAVDENFTKVNNINAHILRGKFNVGNTQQPFIVLGAGVENAVAANVVNPIAGIQIYMPNTANSTLNLNNADAFNSASVIPVGSFFVQQEFDNKYAFTNVGFAQYMLNYDTDRYSYVEVKLNNNANASSVKKSLQLALGKDFVVETLYEQNKSLFTVMQAEKWIIYGVLFLILIIAAFNIIGALTMLVLEKQKDIHILQALGCNQANIQKIFLTEGVLLAAIGGGSGIIIGLIVCIIQIKFKLIKLGGNSFLIDYYPVKMQAADFAIAVVTIAFIAFAAAWLPAKKASKQALLLK